MRVVRQTMRLGMAARAFIERDESGKLRAVCRETDIRGPIVDEDARDVDRSERIALAMLSDACDCDDYHSTMES